jgi:2-polyprenyl-3-methyl-5-hydroxy-6-metoxy-1,4-benzoquinol methylase
VRNWKAYWAGMIRTCLSSDVLEVGAGIGSNTLLFSQEGNGRWVCLEPDAGLAARLSEKLPREKTGRKYEVFCGTLQQLAVEEKFDTILYIDVLEHIENDGEELSNAAAKLKPGGSIIVLSPAHQWLFTPFDKAVGHFRRYNRSMLRSITPGNMHLKKMLYLDSAGLLLSAANHLFLRQSMPSQLCFWDCKVIPVSRLLDPLLRYSIGKSIIAVWGIKGE